MSDFKEWADNRPIFNLNQAQRFTGLQRDSLKVKLSRKVKRGDLFRVEKGKYTAHEDPFIYASYIETPSYISLWSGLDFYNLTSQQPTKVQVVCSRNRRNLEEVEFYESDSVFGYERKRYRNFEVLMADKERLLIDVLKFGKVPVDELNEIVEIIDLQKAVEYAERTGSKSVSKRLGYLVEKIRDETLEELKVSDSNYPLLDLSKSEKGITDSEWRIKVNNNAF
jgi:predicted transcriptional regulator of viral defense system